MAKPALKENKNKGGTESGVGASMLPLAGFVLALVNAVLLAAATLDFKVVDLRPTLHGLELAFAVTLIAGACVSFFATAKISGRRHMAHPESLAAFRLEFEAMFTAQKAAAEEAAAAHRTQSASALKDISHKVEAFIGGEHARLKEENDRLRSHLEGLQRQDAEKIAGELDSLRQKNAELEARITQWAVGSIDTRIERKTLQAA